MMDKCLECGISFTLHIHHIFGRKRKETIRLCPNCHAAFHNGLIIISNRASHKALKEIFELEKNRYVGHSEKIEILYKYGYVAMFDNAYKFFKSIGKIK